MSIDIKLKFRNDIGFTTNTFKQSGCGNLIGEINFHKINKDNIKDKKVIDTSKLDNESKVLTFDFESVESIETVIKILDDLKEKMTKKKEDNDMYNESLILAQNS